MKKLLKKHRALIQQFLKFGTVGFVCFFIDYGFFRLALDVFDFGRYGSALFSFPIGASFTWLGNRLFTFRGKNEGSAHVQWMKFLTVCGVGIIINRGTYSILVATIPLVYEHPILGLMAGTGMAMFFNFFFVKKLVFK